MKGTLAPHQEVADIWTSLFKMQFNMPYLFQGSRDGKAIKDMLKLGLSPGEISELALAAWNAPQTPKFWRCNYKSKTLSDFAQNLNLIRIEVHQMKPRNQGAF